jgi:4-amino-4-deoxy-L-arabinose transferase-like glycosyltransferase
MIHLPVLHRYGWHHDEFYFIACGKHPSFGYVDHAPMVPWIARLATILFGDSIVGLRIFALLAGAATIFLTGVPARLVAPVSPSTGLLGLV